jgi:hypothetical protein
VKKLNHKILAKRKRKIDILSTWFYQITGKTYLGALVNAAIVTWMFASSQAIAPIPV